MNKIKVNFYRFVDAIVEEIDMVQGKNDIPKIQENLKALKQDAEEANTSLKKMMDAVIPTTASSNLKQMRNVTKSNITNLLNEAKNYMNKANASDDFTLKIKAAQDKFTALDKITDYRTAPKLSDVNKFTGIENNLLKTMSTEAALKQRELASATAQEEKRITDELKAQEKERRANEAAQRQLEKEVQRAVAQEEKERQKNIAALRKQFNEEEKNRLAQEKLTAAVKQEGVARSQTSSLMTEVSGGIRTISQGITGITNGGKSFLKHITGVAVTFRILGGAVSGITNTFKNLYDTAASYEEAVNLYRTAMGDYAEQADVWAKKISTALHLDPKDIMQYTGALYNLVQGLGVGSDAAYTMATNLTQLSYDMSSYLNIDVESAYTKIQSAITGQARAVAKAGVAMQIASLQELAYTMGIKKNVSEMTQAEKTYLRYIQLMRSTTNMQQDLGKTILTPENALRVLRAEFVQFARALGQVVIPVVLKVIPYLVALANMLKTVAENLAKTFGFKMTEIDWDNFSTGNEKLKALNDNLKDTGVSAKEARDEIQRTLAPFDELNVVENESKSKGSGGGVGGSSILPQLEEYVTGYDMLGKLTKDFDKSVEEARKNLEKMIPVIKGIAVAFGLWKLAQLGSGFINLVDKFKLGIKEGTGLGGVFKTLATRFSEGFRYAKALGGEGFGAIQYGIQNMLGPLGVAAIEIGTFAGAMAGSAAIMKSWNGETDDLIGKLVGSAGLTTALAVVAGVVAGPWAAAIVAIGGVGGAIIGVTKAMERMREEEEYQKAYDTLFDGQGISLNRLQYELNNTFGPLEEYNTKMQETNNATEDAKKKVDDAKEAIKQLQATMEGSSFEDNIARIDELKTAYDTLRDAVIDADEKEKNRQIAQLDRLLQEGQITKEVYEESKKRVIEYTNLRAAEANGYYKELADLQAQLATGKISQQKYDEEVKKLATDYALVSDHGNDLTLNMAAMYDVANQGFDLENPEAMKTALQKLMTQYNELKDNTTKVYNTSHDLNKQQLDDYDLELATLKRLGKEKTDEYDTVSKARNSLYETDKALTEQYNKDMEIHGATYKDVMLTMLAQIDKAHMTTNSNVSEVVDTIKGNLDSLRNYDASKSTAGIFKSFAENFEKDGGTFSKQATNIFSMYASEIGNNYELNLSKGVKEATERSVLKLRPQIRSQFSNIGEYSSEGLGEGLNNSKSQSALDNSINNMSKYTITHTRDKFGVHSPSTVFEEIGGYLVEGLAKGINGNIGQVERALNEIVYRVNNAMKGQTLSLNIDTNIEKSLNSILSKIQTFCNNWRKSINSLISSTGTAINSIKISNGKLSFSAIPNIYVPKFAEGGFPNSGDLFFANENGVPEYITSIGNRSAVANQDQMVSALSGAIITAMSKIPTNTQPSNITVYVGDKKLYEGQGEYQNRQNDRYGTTVVRI